MSVTFGKRVAGEKEHAAAVARAVGGAEVFGKRVRGMIPEPNAELAAKRNSEFGPRTTAYAHLSDTKGHGSVISVEDLKKTLSDNESTFDSLYEQELALPSGPRKAALEVLAVAEVSKQGAARLSVLNEINALLGRDKVTAERMSKDISVRQEQYARQAERAEENKVLRDAPRVQALMDREKNLDALKSAKYRGTQNQLVPADEASQRRSLGGEGIVGESAPTKKGKPKKGSTK